MAVLISFNGGVSVNMQNPGTLYGSNVFGEFGGHVEWSAEDIDTTETPFLTMHPSAGTAEIWLTGPSLTFGGDGGLTPSGTVASILVNNAADMTSETAFRLGLAFDTPVDFNAVLSAILNSDPRPLWANQPLTIFGDVLNDTLVGGTKSDELYGFSGNDKLIGNGGADLLAGDVGADNLQGAAGGDVLMGGAGKDVLTGGTGADAFVFDTKGNAHADTLKDFKKAEGDLMLFDNSVFTALTGAAVAAEDVLATSAFKQSTNFTLTSGSGDSNDRVLYNPSTGNLFYDPSGAGPAGRVLVATIFDAPDHHPTLTAAYFGVIAG